ncbi:MAG: peptidylprolyl isomerase [Paludibacteraceae bacterium]|nr:peptidylprolyl isomerase [Paludibacteraceae bacterium]
MKKTFIFCMTLVASLAAMAQKETLMTINGKPVSADEFLYIYEKNNQEGAVDPKSMDEYLDMFINFKLKVTEAEAHGIDTTESFKKELKGYRAQAIPKYMQDQQAIDSLVELSWRHMAKDRRAAHIAIQCPRSASEEDVQAAMDKIKEARIRVTSGKEVMQGKGKKAKMVCLPKEDFYAVAREVSTDPNAKENGGELGWITPFRYVYPLEEAIYSTPVGQVTGIFRTQYGFHIALVEEEREHQEVQARHIMKMVPRANETDPEQVKTTDSIANAKKSQIDSIRAIINHNNFEEIARKESDDRGSSTRGGELGWFGKGMMVKPFEDAAFSLNVGEISEPIRSAYGWHIIEKEGQRGIQPLDSMRQQILRQVQRDERIQEADKSFCKKTRREYNLPDTMTDEEVKAYADAHLENKYPELKSLVQEYHDGILLFEVSLREVWDKAAKDTIGLEKYFQANKKNYTWDKMHWKGFILHCKDKSSAKAAQTIVKSADADSVESYINRRLNNDSIQYVKVQTGLYEQGKTPVVDKYALGDKNAQFTPSEQFPVIVCVGKKLKAPETWMDEKGRVTTDYQDYLEAEWIKKLRAKYPVVIDQNVWNQIKK